MKSQNLPQEGQKYLIASAINLNMVIDISGDLQCIIKQRSLGLNQKWMFIPAANGSYNIVNCQDGCTLAIPELSQGQKGTRLIVSQPSKTVNEAWYIKETKERLSIHPACNQQMGVAISGQVLFNGVWMILSPLTAAKYYLWTLIPTD